MIQTHAVEQGTDAWLELRAGKFTGSNAHKLLKFGALDYSLTETSTFKGNWWTKRGHLLESEAIDLYEQITNIHVDRPGFVTNSKWPSAGYSPDGIGADGLIEVKCFDQKKHLELFAGNVPLEVLAQIHFGLMICELKQATLVIYNPTLDPTLAFKMIPIKHNRNIANNFKRILTVKEAVTI